MIGTTYSTSHYEEFEKTGSKEIFEDVIDKMILEGISGMNESFRNVISNLSRDKKRMTILSLLDKDLNLFKRIKALTDKNINKMDHIKDIILMLREYVKVGEVEKKKFGEVMTPLELVKEMLATLPEEVWSNPNLKWLDPANGTGPYPIMVIYKLMKGLESWEPDAEKRYKHIIENMIYVCELQPKNMFLYMCAVDPFDTYKLNIYTGSFLEEGFDFHMKNVWGVDKFDVVVGNPPYNAPMNKKTKQGTTGNFIWDKFVMKSVENLIKNGYLCFVHPPGWRKPNSGKSKTIDVWNTMSNLQLLYLEIHSIKDGLRVFGAGTRYDFYLLQNKKVDSQTTIKTEDGNIHKLDIRDWSFLPNKNFTDIHKILKKDTDECCNIIYNRTNYGADKSHVSRVQDDVFLHPVIHATNKSGIRYVYSSLNDRGHYGVSKVIFGDSGINDVVIDIQGNYAMSQHAMAIQVDSMNEAELLKKALLSDKFQEILDALCYSNFGVDWKIFQNFKKDFYLEFLN